MLEQSNMQKERRRVCGVVLCLILAGCGDQEPEQNSTLDLGMSMSINIDMGHPTNEMKPLACPTVCAHVESLCGKYPGNLGVSCVELCELQLSQSMRECTIAATTCEDTTMCQQSMPIDPPDMTMMQDMPQVDPLDLGHVDAQEDMNRQEPIDFGMPQTGCPLPKDIESLSSQDAVSRQSTTGRTILALRGQINEKASVTLGLANMNDVFETGQYSVDVNGSIPPICQLDNCIELRVEIEDTPHVFVSRRGMVNLTSTNTTLSGAFQGVEFDLSTSLNRDLKQCGRLTLSTPFHAEIINQ